MKKNGLCKRYHRSCHRSVLIEPRRRLEALVALLAALARSAGERLLQRAVAAQAQGAVPAPRFEVDPMWPKPLPNGWYLGQAIGVWVDAQDHIWIIHRSDALDAVEGGGGQTAPTGACCKKAPPVHRVRSAGQPAPLVGRPGRRRLSVAGVRITASTIDHKGNIWIGGNGNGNDGHVLKFTQDGKFVAQFGKTGRRRRQQLDRIDFYLVAKVFGRRKTQRGLRRGRLRQQARRRHRCRDRQVQAVWGAYGNKPR